jgi:hypothetical protein
VQTLWSLNVRVGVSIRELSSDPTSEESELALASFSSLGIWALPSLSLLLYTASAASANRICSAQNYTLCLLCTASVAALFSPSSSTFIHTQTCIHAFFIYYYTMLNFTSPLLGKCSNISIYPKYTSTFLQIKKIKNHALQSIILIR